MSSVTNRIKDVKQPRGGYINPSAFKVETIEDGKVLGEENLHPSVLGMVVDYLTGFVMGAPVAEAFKIPIVGYRTRMLLAGKEAITRDKKMKIDIESLLQQIISLDNASIIAACKACTYDVWFRNPTGALFAKGADETTPDDTTIENIKIMVERSVSFWKKYGPITVDGFTFEGKGYTSTVDSGDGDYLTANTLWDFKVSKTKPTNKHTLQLLMYWIMGQHSEKEEFRNITRLGIFNPRLNTVYTLDTSAVPKDIIMAVEKDVICY